MKFKWEDQILDGRQSQDVLPSDALVCYTGDGFWVHHDGYHDHFVIQGEDEWVGEHSGQVLASLSGRVLKMLVLEGQKIAKGDALCILEAMKMELQINSPIHGVVDKIFFNQNDFVKKEACLLVIKESK